MYSVKTTKEDYCKINVLPRLCPYCHKSIIPIPTIAHQNGLNYSVVFICPNPECYDLFIGFYVKDFQGYLQFKHKTSFGTALKREFNDQIVNISPNFYKIYNEAMFAEQHSLMEICGVGYRKALEYLIKDYATSTNTEKGEHIKSLPLAQCINIYVNDSRVKKVAERAVWLGNDETHYIRKWEEHTLADLKRLIDLTVHWIEMELLTNEYEELMPKPAK